MRAAPVAGWSSPVARQAHNLKVAGSNPAPATISGLTVSAVDLDGRFPGRIALRIGVEVGPLEGGLVL